MVKLGDTVKDRISGFTGIAIVRHEHLNGCPQISVQSKLPDDMKLPETATFDESQLEVLIESAVEPGSKNAKSPENYMRSIWGIPIE